MTFRTKAISQPLRPESSEKLHCGLARRFVEVTLDFFFFPLTDQPHLVGGRLAPGKSLLHHAQRFAATAFHTTEVQHDVRQKAEAVAHVRFSVLIARRLERPK